MSVQRRWNDIQTERDRLDREQQMAEVEALRRLYAREAKRGSWAPLIVATVCCAVVIVSLVYIFWPVVVMRWLGMWQ